MKKNEEEPFFSKKEMTIIDDVVKKATEATSSGKRGKYNTYTPEERARIGKYAAENGATRAAKHFSKTMGRSINESTASNKLNL